MTDRPKIALLVSDVDGTLVTKAKVLNPRNIAAARALDAAGIRLAITSSRPPRGLRMLLEPLAIRTPVSGFNGGMLTTPDLTVIESYPIPVEIGRQALTRLKADGVSVWVFDGARWMIDDPEGPHVDHEERTVQFPPTLVERLDTVLEGAIKIVGVSHDHPLLERCETSLAAVLGGAASVARSQLYYLDVTHPDANKGRGVAAVAQILGIPLSSVAVIGDGSNDVAMFERAAFSIAMGNAAPAVQHAANVVTVSNEEDGFAAAVERYILGG